MIDPSEVQSTGHDSLDAWLVVRKKLAELETRGDVRFELVPRWSRKLDAFAHHDPYYGIRVTFRTPDGRTSGCMIVVADWPPENSSLWQLANLVDDLQGLAMRDRPRPEIWAGMGSIDD